VSPDAAEVRDIAHVLAPPPLLYLGPLVVGLAVDRWWPFGILPAPWRWIAGALCLGVSGLLVAAILAFRRARTRPEPWKPTTALVVDGPYRFTRNPMYLGFTLIYAGVALLANSGWPFGLLPGVLVVMQLFVIRREERYLERKFGDAYRAYCATVRRWL
jgi:protein-S-isoprenylcysteine O-methyltransferase Ste14